MKDSLREKLHALIKEKGYLDYSFAVTFAAEEGYRLSNLERRMRELCNEYPIKPVIKKSKRNTNYIAGWEWIDNKKFTGFKELPDPNYRRITDNLVFIAGKSIPIFKEKQKEVNWLL